MFPLFAHAIKPLSPKNMSSCQKKTPIETMVDAHCFYWRFYVKVIRVLPSYEVHDKLVEL